MRLRASCRLLANYFCKGARNNPHVSKQPLYSLQLKHPTPEYLKSYTSQQSFLHTGQAPGVRSRAPTGQAQGADAQVPTGQVPGAQVVAGQPHGAYPTCPRLKAYKCLRFQALTHRCTQTGIQLHRCPQAWLKAYRCLQTRLQLRTHRCTQTRLQLHRYLQVPASSAPDAQVPAGYLHTASQLQSRPGPKSRVSSRPKNLPYCSHACLDSWCEGSSSVRWSWVKQHACSHCFTASAEAKRRSGYLSGSGVLFTLCVHCQKIVACVPQVAVV